LAQVKLALSIGDIGAIYRDVAASRARVSGSGSPAKYLSSARTKGSGSALLSRQARAKSDQAEASSQNRMTGVGPRLFQAADGKALRHGASPQAFDLGEYKPHPMGALAAAAQFIDDPGKHRILSFQVAFQAGRGGVFIHALCSKMRA
jgi:hypothetical protein